MHVNTGFWWLDVIVCAVSGGAAIGLAWLLPRYIRDQYEFWYQYWLHKDE